MRVDGQRRVVEARAHFRERRVVLRLHAEMVEPRRRAALRDREIDARILEHPFRVVFLDDGRFGGEQRRIEANAVREIRDADVNVEAFHDRCPRAVEHAAAGEQGLPPQQFSVR
ncbi:hypothetical protein DM50_3702 [Burkholderia mallei]|nr:hypothetical protein DM50_3702 [Burkholderia mallei]